MWTKEENRKLIELYPNKTNNEIAIELGKTKQSIDMKGFHLNLSKSKTHLSKISETANLSRIEKGGRDLNLGTLKKIAANFKTRIDFIRCDNMAYTAAIRMGVLDDICSHMTVMKFSIPQLILREITDNILKSKSSYNNRKILKPYEIDVYYDNFNLGFEFQGIAWHLNNKNDEIKYDMAIGKGIKIFYINETSRNYEEDIKKQLINYLTEINTITNKNISINDVMNCIVKNIYSDLYNKEELITIAKTYNSFKVFVKEKRHIYRKLLKLKMIDEATAHMCGKIKKIKYDIKNIKKLLSEYDNLSDFRKKEMNTYKYIKRNKLEFLLMGKIRKQKYNIEDVKNEIKKYNSLSEFTKHNKKLYSYIRKNNLYYLITELKKGVRSIN